MVTSIIKSKIILIICILIVALFFRFYELTSYPVSLSIDEAAIGYNAYSVLQTGQDEWGQFLPLAFRSVGDYKPPVNVYLTVPSIAIFGLNEFGVRFPIALLGSLTAIVFILVLRELKIPWSGCLFGGLWLAISPWHVNFSRSSFEAVTALFFLLLGLLLFLVWTRVKKSKWLVFSIVSFSLSVWSYHSERFFVPLFFVLLLLIFKDKLTIFRKNPKRLILPLLIFLIFTIPFIYLTFFTEAVKTRALSTSILRETNLAQALHDGVYKNLQEFIFNNDIYLIFRHWAGKYLNYFDLRFWFWKGMQFTPPGYPDLGLLYLVDLPIFILGIYSLIFSKNSFLKKIALFWFFAGPLPASFTTNEQHPLRALVWLPFFGFIVASGFSLLWESKHSLKLFKLKWKKIIISIYSVTLIFNVLYFSNIYMQHSPRFFSEFSQYGFKEISQFACDNKNKYHTIVISEVFGSDGPLITGIPYAYYLFYCHYDPKAYLSRGDQSKNVENIEFRRVDWNSDRNIKNLLLIASPWDLPLKDIPEEKIIKKIYFLNGKLGFLFVET